MDDEDDLNVIYSQSSTGSQTVQCTASMTRDFLKPFLELARNKINEIREEKAKQERIKKEKEHLKNLRKLKKLSKAQKEIQKAQVEKEKTQKKMSGVQEGKKKKRKDKNENLHKRDSNKEAELKQMEGNKTIVSCFICGLSNDSDQDWLNQGWISCFICQKWLHLKCIFLDNVSQSYFGSGPYVCFQCDQQQFDYQLTLL